MASNNRSRKLVELATKLFSNSNEEKAPENNFKEDTTDQNSFTVSDELKIIESAEIIFEADETSILHEDVDIPTDIIMEICTESTHSTNEINNDEEANVSDTIENECETAGEFTKTGEKRKQKKYKYSVDVRNDIKLRKRQYSHPVKIGCGETCKKKCSMNFSEDRRIDINKQFWDIPRDMQKNFVLSCTSKTTVKRRTVLDSRRSSTFTYILKNEEGESKPVCKVFFLTTLRYNKSNDKILQHLSKTNGKNKLISKPDARRGRIPHNKADHTIIKEHIESFRPNISHYRREHAPWRRYLPSDLTVKDMHTDFQIHNKNFKCSYDLYRSIVQKLNISFVKLGHEECETCEHFQIHPHSKDNFQDDCENCIAWSSHIKKAEAARNQYRSDAEKILADDEVIYSADLEKIIMLPRCDMFKSVLFTQRLVVYNESFVPVGKKNKLQPVAVIWHEAIRGRKKEDIISTFYKFFLSQRDKRKIVIWLDNCTGQNKNWAFFTFLLYAVNNSSVGVEQIIINYFEPGHTFMSADSFHHQVEKSLRKMRKVYDFADFKSTVQNSNSSHVTILEMQLSDFFEWKDYSSLHKINKKHSERPYLRDIVQIEAQKGKMFLSYKKVFDGPFLPLNFVNAKVYKSVVPHPKQLQIPQGISASRRDNIISKLIEGDNSIMPKNRLEFWRNIPLSFAATANAESDAEDL